MTLYIGDVRDGLRAFIASGIRAQTCVTSPPYWGLRDYGTATWEGGEAGCDHKAPSRFDYALRSGLGPTGEQTQASNAGSDSAAGQFRDVCGKCGAQRIDKQLGLEPTIAEYVATMVDVFRLVRDVLADDGTLWLNLGDSYATGAGAVGNAPGGGEQGRRWREGSKESFRRDNAAVGPMTQPNRMPQAGLKPKDLCGVPWRVAFALQADGWYLRSDIIWHKPNPMPESVTDRPTKSHEYLFLLAKSGRYYYDAAAIQESCTGNGHGGAKGSAPKQYAIGQQIGGNLGDWDDERGRNKRSVWTVTTQPYTDAHFAVMPVALVEPCILAGSRVGDVVLDPFMGSGTVAQVAQSLGRKWIGCELSGDYAAMIHRRTAQQGMEFSA